MKTRIISDIFLSISIFVLPSWFLLLVSIACLFIFENFYEILFLGVILDSLFGLPERFFPIPAVYTFLAVLLFVLVNFLKKHLRFYGR